MGTRKIGLLFLLSVMSSSAFAFNYHSFDLHLMTQEYEVMKTCTDCVMDLDKIYEKLGKENPEFIELIKLRQAALAKLKVPKLDSTQLEKILISSNENALQWASPDTEAYSVSRIVHILSEKMLKESKADPLLYYVSGRAQFHYINSGKAELEKFLSLSSDTNIKYVKLRAEALEIKNRVEASDRSAQESDSHMD